MRKLAMAAMALFLTLPALGQDEHQSYITYDDGDSVLVQSDSRQVDARLNLPVYPGDELVAGARGRSEVRLADGNVLAVDRYSRLKFESLLWSFESSDTQTVVRLLEGQVVIYRLYRGSEPLRLDTSNASYLAAKESMYGVEVNSKGVDLVTVFEGEIEVRTRAGAVAIRAGETAKVDLTGIYSRNQLVSDGASEFEQWFIRRAGRYSAGESRYLDSSLAYVETELSENGEWVYATDYRGYVWRPYVSVGWRPYSSGYWHAGRGGTLAWVSYEPWGWYPYHYGRWGYNSYYGWVWYPGYGYSPAWVYWAWGPSWVGWAPAGWYDCNWGWNSWYYYPYYNNCYNCGHYNGYYRGYGFNGRVTVSSGDLNAYTVVDREILFSNRIDRASLTADEVKNRLARDGNSAVLSNRGVRVTSDELRDPSRVADRIIRGGDGSGTGTSQGTGSPSDVTQFFRRDPNPSASVRDRVTRGLPREAQAAQATRGAKGGSAASPGASTAPGVVTRGTSAGGATSSGTVTRGGTGGAVTRPSTSSTGGTVSRPTGGTVSKPNPSTGSTGGTVSRPTPTTGTRSNDDNTTPGTVRPDTKRPEPGTVGRGSEGNTGVRPRTVTRPTSTAPASSSSGGGTTTTTRPRTVSRPAPAKPTETRPAPSGESETKGSEKPTRAEPKEGDRPVSRAPSRSDSTASNDDWRRGSAGSTDPAQRVITTIGGARISSSETDRSGDTTRTQTTTTRSSETGGDSWRARGTFTSGSSGSAGATRSGASTTSRGSSGVSRPSSGSSSSGSSTTSRPSSGSRGGSTSTRSSGSSSGSGGKAGMSRPSSGSSSSSSSSGGSKSSGSKSSGTRSSGGSSSSDKVSRPH